MTDRFLQMQFRAAIENRLRQESRVMNRRQMVVLPGVALAASRGFSQVTQTATANSISPKSIAHFSSVKALYSVPKSEHKRTKYVNFLTAYLVLTSDQSTQASAIFNNAAATLVTIRQQIKTSRKALTSAVRGLDAANINSRSVQIGTLTAKKHAIGAQAHSAVFQLLTADQQSKLNALQQPGTTA